MLFLKTASGNQPFRKGPCQANNIVRGKVLAKTTASKRTGTPTRITIAMTNKQMKTTFFKEIPTVIPREKLPYAYNLVKILFQLLREQED